MDKKEISLTLDIDLLTDEQYDAILEAFREQARRLGHNPDDYCFDDWNATCVGSPYRD